MAANGRLSHIYGKHKGAADLNGRAMKAVKSIDRGLSESQIQQTCLKWFALQYPKLSDDGMLYHIANEGWRPGATGIRFKREGVVRGVADLCLSVPRHGYGALYIEMKRKGTYQSPEQRQWGENAERHGNRYVVCRSLEEFAKAVNEYLTP